METFEDNGQEVCVNLRFTGEARLAVLSLVHRSGGRTPNTLAMEGFRLRMLQQDALDSGRDLAIAQGYTDGSYEVEEVLGEFDMPEPQMVNNIPDNDPDAHEDMGTVLPFHLRNTAS